ncbi:hypothetical protein D3C71_1431250 [compost metagenome]
MRVVQHAAGFGSALAQAEIGAWLALQHERKILGAHRRHQVAHHVLLADHLGRDIGHQIGVLRCIQGCGIDAFIYHLRRAAESAGDRADQLAHARLDHLLD